MKLKFIKILAIFLAIFTVLSTPSAAIEMQHTKTTTDALTIKSQSVSVENEEKDTDTDFSEPESPIINFSEVSDDTIVAKMYICTQQVGLGHAWIYIESNFNGDMPVGCYTLKPYQGVSIGTFFISRSDGPGLYYNVEAYCANKYGLKNESSLEMDITKEQLLKVSKRIKQWNYWDLYFNCTFFAAEIWNCVAKEKIVPILFPFFVKWQILAHGGKREIVMKNVEPTDCYKQRGVGANAKIYQVKDGTLDSKLM